MVVSCSFQHYPPLSLYIHLPWCVKKCPYCDFNSHSIGQAAVPARAYIGALLKDLEFSLPSVDSRTVNSIFIGGGTPSLFPAESLDSLLSALDTRLSLAPDIEITLEANPATIDAGRFRDFRETGINRLSIGVQSFNDIVLTKLGRIHDAATAHAAIEAAKTAGFRRVNLDMMYGLPGQIAGEAQEDIRQVIAHDAVHLSWYQLTIEPNTLFYKTRPDLPDEDLIWDMQESGLELLSGNEYRQYEISAFAKPGFECRHNLNYWQYGDYLGIGAGAHSKLTSLSENRIYRYARHRLPERYMQTAGTQRAITETRIPDTDEVILEFMMNALRLTKGFDCNLFTQRTGLPLETILPAVSRAVEKGWIERHQQAIRATTTGRNFLNDLLQYFSPGSDQFLRFSGVRPS